MSIDYKGLLQGTQDRMWNKYLVDCKILYKVRIADITTELWVEDTKYSSTFISKRKLYCTSIFLKDTVFNSNFKEAIEIFSTMLINI